MRFGYFRYQFAYPIHFVDNNENFLKFYKAASDIKKKWACTFVLDGMSERAPDYQNRSGLVWLPGTFNLLLETLEVAKRSPDMEIHYFIPGFGFYGLARPDPTWLIRVALLTAAALGRIPTPEDYERLKMPRKTCSRFGYVPTFADLHPFAQHQ